MDGHQICTDDLHLMFVDAENECGVCCGINQPEEIFLAL